jgi:hypothetical protein
MLIWNFPGKLWFNNGLSAFANGMDTGGRFR